MVLTHILLFPLSQVFGSKSSSTVRAYTMTGNSLLSLSYVALFGIWASSYFYAIDMSINVVVTATLIVYIGSHRSLRLLATEEEGGLSSASKEVMSSSDAAQFPIVGSCALFGLFCAFKYLDKTTVNLILGLYFMVVGTFTLASTISPYFEAQFGMNPKTTKKYGFKKDLPLIGEVDALFNTAELISLIPSMIISYQYFKTKHYMLNNFLGISFCVQSISRISIGSYKIGAILLCGLFFYDIFWVFGSEQIFGSNVMVTVAKSFDGPIKLLFPKNLPGSNVSENIAKTLVNAGNSTLIGKEVGSDCLKFIKSVSTQLGGTDKTLEMATNAFAFSKTGGSALGDACVIALSKVVGPLRSTVEGDMSLLGLGDIVIPGLFVSILLRFDGKQAKVRGLEAEYENFPKPYFHWNIVFYALGLVATLVVMNVFKAAQPALLYLVPACLSASFISAQLQGNFTALWKYSEEEEEENEKGEKDNESEAEKKSK